MGEESNAVGIVESGSTDSLCLVSNIVGEFKPGEQITQESSGKVSRIMKDGEIKGLPVPNWWCWW